MWSVLSPVIDPKFKLWFPTLTACIYRTGLYNIHLKDVEKQVVEYAHNSDYESLALIFDLISGMVFIMD